MGESIGMEPTPASPVPQEQTRWLGLKGSAKVPEGWMGKEEGHGDRQTGDRQRQLFKGGRANRAHKSWHFRAGKASLEQPQIPFTIHQGCWHWDVHILGPSSPALGFVWKIKARAERCCTYVHPLPARSCPWQLAGTSAPAASAACPYKRSWISSRAAFLLPPQAWRMWAELRGFSSGFWILQGCVISLTVRVFMACV